MLLALIGLLLTVIWLFGGVWYVAEAIGFENLLFLLPSELGQMATGFLLPLVLLWLVLGYLHIGNRLRRLEETLWEIGAVRLVRNGGGSPAPGGEGWLDLEKEEPQGQMAGAAAMAPSPRSRRSFAGGADGPSRASGGEASSWTQRSPRAQAMPAQPASGSPTGAEPRRGGLASEIFSSRLRDRLTEEQAARPRDLGAARSAPPQSAASQPAAATRGAAKPPPTRPTQSQTDASRPAAPKAVAQKPAARKPAAPRTEWQKPSPPPAAVTAEPPPAPPLQQGEAAPQPQETPAAPPQKIAETPVEAGAAAATAAAEATAAQEPPKPLQPDSGGASEAPAATEAAAETGSEAPPQAAPSSETPQSAPEQKVDAAPEADAERDSETAPAAADSSAPASKPVGFRHLVRITSMELNSIAMDLSGLLCRDAEHAQALKGYDKGQKDVFFDLLSDQLAKQKPAEALKRLQNAGGDQLMINYLRKFDALVTESKGVDRSGALAKSLQAMPIGRLNAQLQALRAETW